MGAVRFATVITTLLLLLTAPAFAANVGFEEIKIANGAEPPLTVGVWYPTDAPATEHPLGNFKQVVAAGGAVAGRGLPLVVMSHGGGGWYDSHYDTALALARAGFVAAAVAHTGDTFEDQSKVLQLWRRPAQLHRLVEYMLHDWPGHGRLSACHVGAFGFSNGGFSVLVAVGGVPQLSEVGAYCQAHADHDLCRALKHAGVDPQLGTGVPAGAWILDPHIKAAVIAAPSFGFTFDRAGLSGVRVPIQLWRAGDDQHQPYPYYEESVQAALPQAPEFHFVANAGHYDFLPPCDARLARMAPAICTSHTGFDRSAFHDSFNADVVRFFQAKLNGQPYS